MNLFRTLINNRLYFWLLFCALTFISYISIYQGLVLNRSYSLIVPYFMFNIVSFIWPQLILIFILRVFLYDSIDDLLSKRINILFIFLFGCIINYILLVLGFYI